MPKIITFSHQKGGVGKSTLAFNVAKNINRFATVCIIDFDSQGSLMQVSEMVDFDIAKSVSPSVLINLEYDFVIVDTPPYFSNNLDELFKISDVIVVPTKAGILDLFAIRSTIELISDAGKSQSGLIVFNMVKPNTTLTGDIFREVKKFDVSIAKTFVSDLVAFTRSILIDIDEGSKGRGQIDLLTAEIIKKII